MEGEGNSRPPEQMRDMCKSLKSRSNYSLDLLLPVFLVRFPSERFQESIVFFFIILRQMRVFLIREDSPFFIKKSLKNIASAAKRNTSPQLWNARDVGLPSLRATFSWKRVKNRIRRESFLRAVFVLDKTCSYKWYSSVLFKTRLIFPRINGPNSYSLSRRRCRVTVESNLPYR